MKSLSELSLEIATKYHAGQTRWDKKIPYISHPIKVAELAKELYPKFYGNCDSLDIQFVESVALLHDVLEDCDITEEILLKELDIYDKPFIYYPATVLKSVKAITKNADKSAESYLEYILRAKSLPYSRVVKIADITHNSSDLKPGSMKDKYSLAKYILEN
jgi:(p)ppGpp synthase/HD superfamily hydrolase